MTDSDLDTLVRQVTEGFSLLCEEYRALAEQHWRLDQRLSSKGSQFAIPTNSQLDDISPPKVDVVDLQGINDDVRPLKSLADWLEENGRNEASKQDTIQKIKEAEFASFKLQARLRTNQTLQPGQIPTLASVRSARLSRRTRPRFGGSGSQTPDIEEQDFTTSGTPGELRCPYAPSKDKTDTKEQACVMGSNSNNFPTPRSTPSCRGVSQARRSRSGSKRASFVDPIRPILKPPSNAAPSEAVSNEPGCPIRFLNQHSPEDLAKYFEEHKHELPRSHEICVKRFQDNADSIKELDAKYGNLVAMIQGLGAKHQPMLPEVPNSEGNPLHSEDDKSAQKVENWAREVSDSHHATDHAAQKRDDDDDDDNAPNHQSHAQAEERLPHFDRPLKEIRVGESPSRPWGVPIPSKYFDRLDSELSSEVAAPPQPTITHNFHENGANHNLELQSPAKPINMTHSPMAEDTSSPTKKKGKCPFDHLASREQKKRVANSVGERATDMGTNKAIEGAITPANAFPENEGSKSNQAPQLNSMNYGITNYGVTVISGSHSLEKCSLTNHGTLLLGFDEAASAELIKVLRN